MWNRKCILAVAVLVILARAAPGFAQEFLFTADIPAKMGSKFYTPNQVFRLDDAGNYTLFFDGPANGLGADAHISALAATSQGAFLFAADAPFTAGGNTYLPYDVVQYSGGAFSLYQSGSALSIPAGAVIDALALDASNVLYYSFDVPVTIGSNSYLPNDVVRLVSGHLIPFLTGSSDLGLPVGSDVVGFAAPPGGDYFFMFRTPTTLAGTAYLPTQIVRMGGGSWSLFWNGPAGGVVMTFSFPPAPGAVPGEGGVPGVPLTLAKSGSNAQLTWGASCTTDANDYAVYRGTLGNWYSHASVVCTTGGATTATVTPGSGNEYYLVVPTNGIYEGSYGAASTGAQIPAASAPCRAYRNAGNCP